jgi:hypothetical protein
MKTQAEINDLLHQFMSNPTINNQRVEYYGYPGECLSLAKRWLDVVRNGYLNGPMAAPPATAPGSLGWGSDYWLNPPALLQELFDKQTYNPNAAYPAGSLFVNLATHHIGIMLDNQPGAGSAYVYHQNANPDHSPAHSGTRSKVNIDGILVLKVAPVAPPRPLYVATTDGFPKHLQLVRNASKWDCNRTDFNDRAAHPIEQHTEGYDFTAVALYTTQDGNRYYSPDMQNSGGFHIDDCDWYKAPSSPYVPPAAPLRPVLVTPYPVIKKLMVFETAEDAKGRRNYTGIDVEPGDYIEIERIESAVLLSKDNKTDIGWINTFDNKLRSPSR